MMKAEGSMKKREETLAPRAMRHVRVLPLCACLVTSAFILLPSAFAQLNRKDAYAGYVYPAGARVGTTVHVLVGGQFLQGARAAYVSGDGVKATVRDYGRPFTPKQLGDIGRYLRAIVMQKLAQATGRPGPPLPKLGNDKTKDELEIPDHPWLRDLDKKSLKELDDLRLILFDKKKQPNTQIGEMLWMDLAVDPKATPGVRELRIETPMGLTNPVRFVVGALPEAIEQEPNSLQAVSTPLDLPVVVNGQILPGDADVCRFKARQGQKLVITADARSLIPYLADAVPGWFQATLTLYDASGRQLAQADDYRFDPDPVLFFAVPQDGEYALEIHDSIYRGREDFVYRVTIAEQPFITSVFPLGGHLGAPTTATVTGWNLPANTVQLDTRRAGDLVVEPALYPGPVPSTRLCYAVDGAPEVVEAEPNDSASAAQKVTLPQVVNGRIGRPGDTDTFRFDGQANEEIVAEVQARRLGSPLDSLLRLEDPSGHVIEMNDDHVDPSVGLLTHQADSYLSVKLPRAGACTLVLTDTQQHGGEDYAYRLRLGPRQPDFALRVTPSSLKVVAGRSVPLVAHLLRRDGFNGAVDLSVAGNTGLVLSGGHIAAGQDVVHMTLTAPAQATAAPLSLQFEGRATIGGQTVTRAAEPAEDMMQAFAYRQLVPSQECMAIVAQPPRWLPVLQVASGPVRIAAGGTAQLQVTAPAVAFLKSMRLDVQSAPEGLTIRDQSLTAQGISATLEADQTKLKPGAVDNLVLEVFVDNEIKRGDGKKAQVRASLGVLPAVPVEILP